MSSTNQTCAGMAAYNGKQCTRPAARKYNGYCAHHKNQYVASASIAAPAPSQVVESMPDSDDECWENPRPIIMSDHPSTTVIQTNVVQIMQSVYDMLADMSKLNDDKNELVAKVARQDELIQRLGKHAMDTSVSDSQARLIEVLEKELSNAKESVNDCKKINDELTEQLSELTCKMGSTNELTIAATMLEEENVQLKKQLHEATQKAKLMQDDYNTYQEIRNFEEISTRLMAIYMASNHYELYGLMRDKPSDAIPYLGQNPEIQYNCLRQRRNKHCHPTPSV